MCSSVVSELFHVSCVSGPTTNMCLEHNKQEHRYCNTIFREIIFIGNVYVIEKMSKMNYIVR